jgi:hypothetical protein
VTFRSRIGASRLLPIAQIRHFLVYLRLFGYPQAAVVTAGFLGILYLAFSFTILRKPDPPAQATYRPPERVAPEPLRHRSRKVYPFSVVPGGIYEASEVRDRMKSDPVVYAHYQGVKADNLKPVQLSTARLAYVSYRRGDRIYWTRKPVKIAAGETVWTDGKSKIRARCGNMLAENPQLPTYWMDPSERQLNQAAPNLLILPARAGVAPIPSKISGSLPVVEDPGSPLFAPMEEVASWFPSASAGPFPGVNTPGGGSATDPNNPVTPPGPNPPGPNPPDPDPPVTPPGPNPPDPNPPGPNPPGPNPPDPNPPGPNPPGPNPPDPNPPVTPPGPNPPGPNPPGPNPPGPNPPGPNPPGPNPPGPNPPGPNPPGPNPPGDTPPDGPPNPPCPTGNVCPPDPPDPPCPIGSVCPPDPPDPPCTVGTACPPDPPDPPDPPCPPGTTCPPDPPDPPNPVPEPSTHFMIGAGLTAIAVYRKRHLK